ncbi:GNAT family N-acetyltransferase [Chelatococcus sp. SYSU_G07232]|uniref:GNAT family N-acetyltransferase n=1 Tax=Chelatococcus albus TaxID=3047466 RepID=A0ABT7AFI1_9HYPH|nr:GNAT family N-acetyltransferase [Chelatococcus sp. SYSU_G07232]MDJ1158130.1 GNAT family N-acetyltransferase [Chelatococcus sp. SYSU_G07232]
MLRDGYTDIPPGKIASIVTYLDMTRRPPARDLPPPGGFALAPLRADHLRRYRAVYRAVGEPWLWFGRLGLGDDALAAILGDADVAAFAAVRDGRDIGLLELDFRTTAEGEIVYFGLVPEAIGGGAGRWLMERALELAWARPIKRLMVHTCSLDHPAALDFYIRSGFRPYKRAVEVGDDPRLTGALPRAAAPHVPLLEG